MSKWNGLMWIDEAEEVSKEDYEYLMKGVKMENKEKIQWIPTILVAGFIIVAFVAIWSPIHNGKFAATSLFCLVFGYLTYESKGGTR